ncbi:MAG TPA: hypothetical protein PK156_47965 [Polyangium sp.]|nr:hypothetical protein [Polyangium sp.]
MRKLRREPLSAHALQALWDNTIAIADAGHPRRSSRARRKESEKRWSTKPRKTFDEIRETLRKMSSGIERCMYCESNQGTDIEHFWPKKLAPCRTFDWNNLLLACSTCNSNHKRDRFPRMNGKPLLINPVDDDPAEHIALSPSTGNFDDLTERGTASIDILGLNRTALTECRRDAWISVQLHINAYAEACCANDELEAAEIRRVLTRAPHASVFENLLRVAETKIAEKHISAKCLQTLAAYPEIKTWLL